VVITREYASESFVTALKTAEYTQRFFNLAVHSKPGKTFKVINHG
jgi:hypothetical protein